MKVGDKFPLDTLLLNTEGETKLLSDLISLPCVIYFYPKDMTPGCTDEACSIRDVSDEIRSLGYFVCGISSDDQNSHKKFIQKYTLNFPLFSDLDQSLQKKVGVWVEKSMYGKKYMGTMRSTFVLDKAGTVIATWGDDELCSQGKVLTKTHGEQLLSYLKEVSATSI
ncbi:peroxiredoxin [Candidatus Dojkabacteria bacterium]|uniref:thioredoxin-dependent peroxiredoxin n=1 Tax=Candidatus Dojkabacteria bacterium TaxID=2099670 RepID=A0A3M0Z039_9BACT|nr:MAG: peroxiredoxin [Candidatus Dojkabacteria bacterium]